MRGNQTTVTAGEIQRGKRKGAIAVFTAVLMIPILGMVAFTVDYGYLLKKRADLQRAADAAALAAVRDLVPDSSGYQDLARVRALVHEYAALNISEVENFTVLDSDIQIGKYDPATVYDNVTLLNSGTFDTVIVTLRFDNQANSPVSLFFAKILGINESDLNATATAILPKGSVLTPGVGVLPFSIPKHEWDSTSIGEVWTIYGDGKLEDNIGAEIPGNWGTCDIGLSNNSTDDLRDQVLNGLRQKDLDALYAESRIPSTTQIDGNQPLSLNGDPGISTGMKSAVQAAHGTSKLIPIYDSVAGNGSGVDFHVVGWAVCEVIDSKWGGEKNTYVKVRKSYTYDGFLKPQSDLSITTGVIEGAFSSAALLQ